VGALGQERAVLSVEEGGGVAVEKRVISLFLFGRTYRILMEWDFFPCDVAFSYVGGIVPRRVSRSTGVIFWNWRGSFFSFLSHHERVIHTTRPSHEP
jgi:hypothetical protein